MFTPDDRKELIGIFQHLKTEIVECLQNQALPSSITHDGEKVGITIEFRKLYPEDVQSSGDDAEGEQAAALRNHALPTGIALPYAMARDGTLYTDGTLYISEDGTTWSPKNEH